MKTRFYFILTALFLISFRPAVAQVPVLSSYPSASAVIFLDFDGHTVQGTSWNSMGPLFCNPSGLSAEQIEVVFNRVAEDYRPFNVNITTDSTKYFAAPANKRTRVILTTTHQWYGAAGGCAFIGSFTWGDNTPCFVFTAALNNNVKNISEAAAHEAGHTLGLYHQSTYDENCVKTSDYNYGQGSGEIGWAPIMGIGYYQNMTVWNIGPNSMSCTNFQSDLDIITTNNGFSYRTDDHAGSFAGATHAAFTGNEFTVTGVIERNTDQDIFRFTQPETGTFQLTAVPYSVGNNNAGSNLDLQVTLYNAEQTVLNVYNPGALLHSFIDTVLNGGEYYLKVEGKGNMYAPNYASLGSFGLAGSFTTNATPLPLRRLEINGHSQTDKHFLTWIIDADEEVIEQLLEVSTDGRNFTTLTEPGGNAREYNYKPGQSGPVQYRLKVTFDNGRYYYSNIITLRSHFATPKPIILGNPVTGATVSILSQEVFGYSIYDMSGKMIVNGRLQKGNNTITTAALSRGIYIIRYTNDTGQWTDKIVRQ